MSVSSAVVGSIPLDLEIIVHIAFRHRGAAYAEPHGFGERFRVRSPDELEYAVDEMHAAAWHGILALQHEVA